MTRSLFYIFIILLCSTSIAAADAGKDLFESKCQRCHSLERALKRTKDLPAWKKTVKRMSRYAKGTISDNEAGSIAEYLASLNKAEEGPSREIEKKEKIKEIDDIEKHQMFDFKKVRVDQFIEPDVCEGCHSEIYEQWNGSMHSRAFTDPLWRNATKLFLMDAKKSGEILEMKACVKCHTPLGFRSYTVTSPADDYEQVTGIPAQGIFCNWCHNISEVKHLGDAGYEVSPGGGEDDPSTMLGPRKDADSPYHPTAYSELHTRSEFCGLCHNVSHAANGLPLEETYNEWKNSPYNTGDPDTTVHCQDCHMRQRPGVPATGRTKRPDNPGFACDSGPERPHIWTHYFVGGNSVVTKLMGSDLHAKMAVERLQHAADLELIRSGPYKVNTLSQISVKVINSGAGHYLPTGLTEVRQMWLELKVTDAEDRVLLRSGDLDMNGNIDRNAVIYHTKLGNELGEPVINVALADRILYDHRVPPKGYQIERFAFFIPESAVSPLKVKVKLRYRSASQALADILLGKDAQKIPAIDMVVIEETIAIE